MTEDEITPFDGGEVPDDPALKARVVKAYQNTPAFDAGAVSRCVRMVLERVTSEHPVPAVAARNSRRWMVGAAAIAAALLVSVTLRNRTGASDGGSADGRIADTGSAAGDATKVPVATTTAIAGGVRFDLRLPKGAVANVSVIGDFNGWDSKATPMVRDAKSGEWSANIALLPGRHIYAYLVDGEKWVVDPLKPQIPDVGYGPANAVVVEEDSK